MGRSQLSRLGGSLNKALHSLSRTVDAVAGEARPRAGPENVEIHLTSVCDLRCIACVRSPLLEGSRRLPMGSLSRPVLEELVDDLADLGTKTLLLGGIAGDPLCSPDLPWLARRASDAGLRVSVITALTGLAPALAADLACTTIETLGVSLWAATPEAYAATHPGAPPGTFERILETLALISRDRERTGRPRRVVLHQVLCRGNAEELEEMVRLGAEVGADAVKLMPARMDHPLFDEARLSAAQLARDAEVAARLPALAAGLTTRHGEPLALDEFDDFVGRLGVCGPTHPERWRGTPPLFDPLRPCPDPREAAMSLDRYNAAEVRRTRCLMGWYFSLIGTDGRVYPCSNSPGLVMGNLNRSSFREIWRGAPYAEYRRACHTGAWEEGVLDSIGCLRYCINLGMNRRLGERVGRRVSHDEGGETSE